MPDEHSVTYTAFVVWHKGMPEAIVVQGCMNNFTFGDSNITYYETIAGGAGAGPGWVGRSGVHTHMTNTRITDPEILERRYPVVLHDFSLRKGSGGAGKYRGGDGVIREVSMVLVLSSQWWPVTCGLVIHPGQLFTLL